jgi:hypothetical protein
MPGISVTNIPIAFSDVGGINWVDYWTTRTPTALILTVLSDTSIKLDWTNGVDEDYDGISIERSPDNATWAEIDTTAANIETYTDTTCAAGTLYYYRVRAFKN